MDNLPEPPSINFCVSREFQDKQGRWNPSDSEGYFDGGLQINIFGNSEQYRRLGEFLLRLADAEGSGDHVHFEGLTSVVGNTRLHLIVRNGEYPEYIADDDRP